MRPLRAIIRGAYGEGNFGDDVLLTACHGLLRRVYAAEEIGCVPGARALRPHEDYLDRLLPGVNRCGLAAQASAELVVWGGGTQFYSFPGSRGIAAWSRRALGALAHPGRVHDHFARCALPARIDDRPRFAALGVGLGPFARAARPEARARALFRAMDFVAVRDPESLRLCEAWQVEPARLGADLSLLPGPWSPGAPAPRAGRPGRRIGVIVRDWPHDPGGAAYVRPILSVVRSLRRRAHEVIFVLFNGCGDRSWARLLGSRGETALAWTPGATSLSGFLSELGAFDCLLTTRYHGALAAACLGIPLVCIAIEPKLALVGDVLTAGVWRPPFHAADCLALVDGARIHHDEQRATQAAAIEVQRRRAAAMAREFLDFCSRSGLGTPLPSGG